MFVLNRRTAFLISMVLSLAISILAVERDAVPGNIVEGRDWQVENAFLSGALRGITLNVFPLAKFGDGMAKAHEADVFVMTIAEYRYSVAHGGTAHVLGIIIGNFFVIFTLIGFLPKTFRKLKL